MGSRRRVDCARFQQAQLSQLYIKRQLAEHNMNTVNTALACFCKYSK